MKDIFFLNVNVLRHTLQDSQQASGRPNAKKREEESYNVQYNMHDEY